MAVSTICVILFFLSISCGTSQGRPLPPQPIKTVQINGDVFNCIDVNTQPAFDHPLLKNHTLQMRPSSYPIGFSNTRTSLTDASLWLESGSEKCPDGTVPVFRYHEGRQPSINEVPYGDDEFTLVAFKGPFYGATASLSSYSLFVHPDQYTSSVVRLRDFEMPSGPTAFLQAGSTVNPLLYNDTSLRLFASWSPQFPGNPEGCYNLLCSGFVQTNPQLPLGLKLLPLSEVHGRQYGLHVVIFKDEKGDKWWLQLGMDVSMTVGYWPIGIFGGSPMGSGHFSDEGFGVSAIAVNIQYVDDIFTFRDMKKEQMGNNVKNRKCYNVGEFEYRDKQAGSRFFYGGPGGNCS